MHQRLRRPLLPFAREEDAIAIVRAQQLHEFQPAERIFAATGGAFRQSRRGGKDNAIGPHQCEFETRP